jgi:hypothetical protein
MLKIFHTVMAGEDNQQKVQKIFSAPLPFLCRLSVVRFYKGQLVIAKGFWPSKCLIIIKYSISAAADG